MQTQPETSWAGRLKSWARSLYQRFRPQQTEPIIPSVSGQVSAISPFGRGGQRRIYSTVAHLQEPLAVSILPDKKIIVQREAEDIVQKLKGENDWDSLEGDLEVAMQSPLGKQISTFLNENETDVIEPVVLELIDEKYREVGEISKQMVLIKMVKKNGALALKLFPIIKKNPDKLWYDLLEAILVRLPSETFLQANNMIKSFFATLPTFFLVMRYKYYVSRFFPDDMSRFIEVVKIICNKTRLTAGEDKKWDEAYDKFVSNIFTIIVEKLSDDDFETLLKELLWKPDTIGIDVFNKLMVIKPELKYVIVKSLLKGEGGRNMLIKFASNDPEFKTFLVDFIKKEKDLNIESIPLHFFVPILNGSDFLGIVLGIDNSYAQTPSYRHLVNFYSKSEIFIDLCDQNFIHMIQKVIQKEKELQDSGYVIFYHGRRWEYGFLSDIYSMLYEFKSGKKLNDFIFTHLDDPVIGKVSEKFFESEQKKRERLASEGNPFSYTTKPLSRELGFSSEQIINAGTGVANRQTILFLNKFLFGNMDRLGSNSIHYVLKDANVGTIAFSIQEIFSMFGDFDIYKAHEQKLLALQKKYEALSRYGELLQIAVPKENLDKCVYYTTSGGPMLSFKTSEGTITTDIKSIVEDIDKNPKDIAEFVLINTRDTYGGLNPDSGIKMFSYNMAEPEKMAEFKKEKKELFDKKIEKDLRERNMQEKIATES